MRIGRTLRHLFATRWAARRHFKPQALESITRAITEVEGRHAGEIRVVIEAALDLPELWQDVTPRQRAAVLFGQLGVWDTAANNGVLVYVLLADRDVEILADRGIAERVGEADWRAVCAEMERHFAAGRFGDGTVAGVHGLGRLLPRHFPGRGADPDELPNQPILL